MSNAASQLAAYRKTIDNLDNALVHILAERFRCTDAVGLLKAQHDFPPVDPDREARQFSRLRGLAQDAKADPDFVERLIKSIMIEVVARHRQISADYAAQQVDAP